jgi:hypothetical protein
MASAATQPEPSGHATADHELDDMADKSPSLPVEEDIMQLARLGEIGAIQKLFDSGKFDATYKDEQGITPLHVRTQDPYLRIQGEADNIVVGSNQQPLCPLPLPHPGRRPHQRKRRRRRRNARAMGCKALQLLHCKPPS